MAIEFNDASAREAIQSGKPVVIDFWATWCGPCKKLGPSIDQLAEKYEGKITVGKLNADENDDLCVEYSVRGLPTVIFFKDGEPKERLTGYVPLSKLEEKAETLL